MGCSLAASFAVRIKEIRRKIQPDYLFIEPSGMVITKEMRDVSAMAKRDVSYDIGSFLTLIDGDDFDFLWEARRPLLMGQISDADAVLITKTDLIDADRLNEITSELSGISKTLLNFSVTDEGSLESVMQQILRSSP